MGGTDEMAGNRCFVCDYIIPVVNMMIQGVYKINFVSIKQLEHDFCTGTDQFQRDSGKKLMKLFKIMLEQPVAQRRGNGNPDMPGKGKRIVCSFFNSVGGTKKLMGKGKYFLALFC